MIELHAQVPASQPQAQNSPPLTHRAAKAVEAAKTVAAQQTPAVSQEALDNAVREHVPELANFNAKLQLDIDKESGQVIGRIIDQESGELIKQIPSEEMLRLISKTKQMLGALYDRSV